MASINDEAEKVAHNADMVMGAAFVGKLIAEMRQALIDNGVPADEAGPLAVMYMTNLDANYEDLE
jgi:pyrroline-5-carboxylate reductase